MIILSTVDLHKHMKEGENKLGKFTNIFYVCLIKYLSISLCLTKNTLKNIIL